MDSALNFFSKFYLSKTLLYWYTPACYLSAVLAHSYQVQLDSQTFRIHALALITTLLTIGFLYLCLLALKSFRNRNHALSFNLIVISSVGAIRGIFMMYLGALFDLDSGLSTINRVTVSTTSTLFWILGLAYVINSHQEYQSRYRSLISRSLAQNAVGITDSNLKAKFVEVERSLKSIPVLDLDGSPNSQHLMRLAQDVKNQVDELIKPLSKRLWVSSMQEYPRVNLLRVIVDSVTDLRYSPIVAASLTAIIASSTLHTFMPTSEALGRICIFFTSVWLLGHLFQVIRAKLSIKGLPFSAAELALLSLIPILSGDFVYNKSHFTFSDFVSLAVYLIIPFLVLGLSITSLIKGDQTTLLRAISYKLTEVSTLDYQTNQVASYFHNSLQSELLAISKKLELAASSDDEVNSRVLVEQLGALINRSIGEDFQNFYLSPNERLNQVQANWQGIVDIAIHNREAIFTLENKSMLAIQLIEELVSNLAKHSEESSINIDCSIYEGCLRLRVRPFYDLHRIVDRGLGTEFIKSFLLRTKYSHDVNQRMLIFEL